MPLQLPGGLWGRDGVCGGVDGVNDASLTVSAAVLPFGGWYVLSGRRWFSGPVPDAGIDDELRWSVDRPRDAAG